MVEPHALHAAMVSSALIGEDAIINALRIVLLCFPPEHTIGRIAGSGGLKPRARRAGF